MKKAGLEPKEQQIFDYICENIRKNGYSPSIRDIGISCKMIFDCTVPFDLKDRFQRAPFMEVDYKKWLV